MIQRITRTARPAMRTTSKMMAAKTNFETNSLLSNLKSVSKAASPSPSDVNISLLLLMLKSLIKVGIMR